MYLHILYLYTEIIYAFAYRYSRKEILIRFSIGTLSQRKIVLSEQVKRCSSACAKQNDAPKQNSICFCLIF